MAQRAEIVFTDDMDGSEAAGTVRFGLQGTTYEIDLSQKNADQLAKVLEPYVNAGRKVISRRPAARSRAAGPSPAAVREWAGPRAWRSRTRAGCPPSSSSSSRRPMPAERRPG